VHPQGVCGGAQLRLIHRLQAQHGLQVRCLVCYGVGVGGKGEGEGEVHCDVLGGVGVSWGGGGAQLRLIHRLQTQHGLQVRGVCGGGGG
jgi:hypothetical protein